MSKGNSSNLSKKITSKIPAAFSTIVMFVSGTFIRYSLPSEYEIIVIIKGFHISHGKCKYREWTLEMLLGQFHSESR